MFYKNNSDQHPLFFEFNFEEFYNKFKTLRTIKPNQPLLVITDHEVNDEFFWELSEDLIECQKRDPFLPKETILTVPPSSTENEFLTLLEKVKNGVLLIDDRTFHIIALQSKNPIYYFSDRLVIYRNGETNFLPSMKYAKKLKN